MTSNRDQGEAPIRGAYGESYNLLVTLKNKYDPTNFFRMNQNVRPTAQAWTRSVCLIVCISQVRLEKRRPGL
jgi:hypothetical protein